MADQKLFRNTKQGVQQHVYDLLRTGYQGTYRQIASRIRKNPNSISSALGELRRKGLARVLPGTFPYVYSIVANGQQPDFIPIRNTDYPTVSRDPTQMLEGRDTTVLVEGNAEIEVNENEILIRIQR